MALYLQMWSARNSFAGFIHRAGRGIRAGSYSKLKGLITECPKFLGSPLIRSLIWFEHPEKAGVDPGISEISEPVQEGTCFPASASRLGETRLASHGASLLAGAGCWWKSFPWQACGLGPCVGSSSSQSGCGHLSSPGPCSWPRAHQHSLGMRWRKMFSINFGVPLSQKRRWDCFL